MKKMKSEKTPCVKTERKSEHKTSRYATSSKERVSDLKQKMIKRQAVAIYDMTK